MAWQTWKKRLAWCLSIPVAMTAAGWVALEWATAKIDAQIHAEELKLEVLGLTVRLPEVGWDAAVDYVALANAIRETGAFDESSGSVRLVGKMPDSAPLLPFFEEAVKGPALFITASTTGEPMARDARLIGAWWLELAKSLASNPTPEGLATLTKLGDLASAGQLQAYRGRVDASAWKDLGFMGVEPIGSPLWARESRSPKTLAWLRNRLNNLDITARVKASLSGKILFTRRSLAMSSRPFNPPNWSLWDRLQTRTPLFKKQAELALLRAWDKVAFKVLVDPRKTASVDTYGLLMRHELGTEPTTAARWAYSQDGIASWHTSEDIEVSRRLALINLDLLEALRAGKPIDGIPTAPYWKDPASGVPVKARLFAKKLDHVEIKIRPANGRWASTTWLHL